MRLTLSFEIETDFYQLEEAVQATQIAKASGGEVYTWKTTGRSNWIERRFSCVDSLGLVVLPAGLDDTIEMADDPAE